MSENFSAKSISASDIMLLLERGAVNADIFKDMLFTTKKTYVDEIHKASITHIENGKKAGKWKTYIGNPRKELLRSTEKELYEALYTYYSEQEKASYTFRYAKEAWLDYKLTNQNRSPQTIQDYRYVIDRFIPESFQSQCLRDITEENVERLFAERTKALTPKEDALKKALQYVRAIFQFGIRQKWCFNDPTVTVDLSNLYSLCELTVKTDDEKEFSPEEVELIKADALKRTSNPRALIELLAAETGMRSAELCSLKWEDIETNYIHIHRQQLLDNTVKGQRRYYEVLYTKDERKHPHGGRRFPRTPEIDEILVLAKSLKGDSIYVFHDPDVAWIKKDGYGQHLKKRCIALGIETTNNHAFRMALNSKLISEGYSPAERSLLLGHSVETNERHYSLTDRRTLGDIRSRMLKEKPDSLSAVG